MLKIPNNRNLILPTNHLVWELYMILMKEGSDSSCKGGWNPRLMESEKCFLTFHTMGYHFQLQHWKEKCRFYWCQSKKKGLKSNLRIHSQASWIDIFVVLVYETFFRRAWPYTALRLTFLRKCSMRSCLIYRLLFQLTWSLQLAYSHYCDSFGYCCSKNHSF